MISIINKIIYCVAILISLVLAPTLSYAVLYDFDNQVAGISTIPLNNAAGRETFIEITENYFTPANDVLFKFTNFIPPENTIPDGEAAINWIYFDTGNYTDLVAEVTIWEQSTGVHMAIPGNRPIMNVMNSFDTYFTEDFSTGIDGSVQGTNNGINPGEYLVLNVTLGSGKTFDDLLNAIDVGRDADEIVARTGFRISEIVHRIWGVAADADHAVFVLASVIDESGPSMVISSLTATPMVILDSETSMLEVVALDLEPGPSALSYQWTIVSGGGVLDDATLPDPIYYPADVVGSQSVTLRVEVSDGEVMISDELTLIVDDADPPPPGMDLLVEDFSSGSIDGWSIYDDGAVSAPSKWRIVGTSYGPQLMQNSAIQDGGTNDDLAHFGTYISYDEGMGWTDYRLRFTMRTSSDSDTMGVMFRIADSDNYYRFTWDKRRNQRRLVKNTGGVFSLLAADNVPYVQYQNYEVEIVVRGDQIEIWIDGVRIFHVTDSDHGYGTFGFHTWMNSWAYFDDVQVEDLSGGTFNIPPQIISVEAVPASILDTETSDLLVVANDPDDGPQALSYQWTIVSGGGVLDDATLPDPIYYPADVVGSQSVTLRVEVSDGEATVNSSLTLQVLDADAPPANLPPQIISVEAIPASILDTETSDLLVVANDPDDGPQALSYQWTIVSGGGVLDDATLPDPIYYPADVVSSQSVTLRVEVSDGEATVNSSLTLQVLDADAPPANLPPQIISVEAVPASILDTETSDLLVVANDPDDGPQALSYQWTIVSGGGVLDDATLPDPIYYPADVVGSQSVTLRVEVSDGEVMISDELTLIVDDADPPPPGVDLLVEDFSSGSLDGWSIYDDGTVSAPSKWRIAGSLYGPQLMQNSAIQDGGANDDLAHLGTYISYDEGMGWTDYRLRFTMRTSSDSDTMGVMFRIADSDNYYRFTWDKRRNQRRLVKNTGGVFSLLAADNVPYVQYQNYEVEIVVRGDQIEIWIDGVRIFHVTDSDHGYGTFGFHTWMNSWAYFDDVQVEDLSGGTFNIPPQIISVEAVPASILDTETSDLLVVANDPDDGPQALSYQWTIVSGGGVLDDATLPDPIYYPADVVSSQSVTLRVEVSDGEATVNSSLTLQVLDADAPPANLPPQIISVEAVPASILDTETSDLLVVANDPDDGPQALSYQWTIVSGGGVLDDATLPDPIYYPADVVGSQSVTLRVEVSDGEVMISDELTLIVDDADPPPPGVDLLVEDFSSGSLDGWSIYDDGTVSAPSKWRIAGSLYGPQLMQNSAIQDGGANDDLAHLGTYISYDEGMGWTDYRLRFTMRTSSDSDTMGVMFRIADSDNYYRFTWDKRRNQRRLVKNTGGVFSLLAADNVPYVQYQNYEVEIVVRGDQIEIWIDGVRIFHVTDSDHGYGTFGFHTWMNSWAYFDDVQVEDLNGG